MSASATKPPTLSGAVAFAGGHADLSPVWAEYWTQVLPAAAAELARWERRAREIPDPELRGQALASLVGKRWNALGVTMFATGCGRHRTAALRHILALQLIYDYVDTVSEGRPERPARERRHLHSALIDAVDPMRPEADRCARGEAVDGGYLAELVAEARRPIAALPAHRAARPVLLRLTSEIAEAQGRKHGSLDRRVPALQAWADPRGGDWIELGAAGCSPLSLHACAALAAHPATTKADVRRTEDALRPAAALDALLDSYVDERCDRRTGELNWLSLYDPPETGEAKLIDLIDRALAAVRRLPRPALHGCVLHSMIGYYLSDPEATGPPRAATTARLLRHAGPASELASEVLAFRRDPVRLADAAAHATERLRELGIAGARRC